MNNINKKYKLNQRWEIYSKNIRTDRADKIINYAEQYLEPILLSFPELKEKIFLLLRKHGWFAKYKPVMQIVIREEALKLSYWRIRSTTAHELLHLVQYINGIGIEENTNNLQLERQATFLTFSRGFSYDYIKSFPSECNKKTCDHKFKYAYFCCDKIFKECCKRYTENEMQVLSDKLTELSSSYSIYDNPDYNKIIYDCCIKEIT